MGGAGLPSRRPPFLYPGLWAAAPGVTPGSSPCPQRFWSRVAAELIGAGSFSSQDAGDGGESVSRLPWCGRSTWGCLGAVTRRTHEQVWVSRGSLGGVYPRTVLVALSSPLTFRPLLGPHPGDVTWSKTRREGVSVRSERLRGLPKVDHRQGDIKAEGTQETKELRPET